MRTGLGEVWPVGGRSCWLASVGSGSEVTGARVGGGGGVSVSVGERQAGERRVGGLGPPKGRGGMVTGHDEEGSYV